MKPIWAGESNGPVWPGPTDHREDRVVFLGEDLLSWLVLALGGAMAVGNIVALVRPPDEARHDDDLERAPLARSVVFIVIGAVAAVWALASLVSG